MEAVDVVVIGGGAMGSAAAWQLARRGASVVLLERFAEGHHHGASHGATRNFTTAYDQDDLLELLVEATALWHELEEETSTQLLDLVGLVNHGWEEPLRRVRAAHERHGIASSFLTAQEARERWPGLRFAGDVLFVPDAGRVRAAQTLTSLRTAAERGDCVFRYDTPARGVHPRPDGTVAVVTDDAEYRARSVVVTAGAWAEKVVGDLVPLPPLRVTQEQPAHFAPLDDAVVWPSFNHSPDPADPQRAWWPSGVYGMLTPGEGVKAGWHGVGPETDPDERSYRADPALTALLQRYARDWLPGVDPDRFDLISCTYTLTPDEFFVVDRRGPLTVGAGFSGQGFKFTPVIGRLLAGLVLDGDEPLPRFALGRR